MNCGFVPLPHALPVSVSAYEVINTDVLARSYRLCCLGPRNVTACPPPTESIVRFSRAAVVIAAGATLVAAIDAIRALVDVTKR